MFSKWYWCRRSPKAVWTGWLRRFPWTQALCGPGFSSPSQLHHLSQAHLGFSSLLFTSDLSTQVRSYMLQLLCTNSHLCLKRMVGKDWDQFVPCSVWSQSCPAEDRSSCMPAACLAFARYCPGEKASAGPCCRDPCGPFRGLHGNFPDLLRRVPVQQSTAWMVWGPAKYHDPLPWLPCACVEGHVQAHRVSSPGRWAGYLLLSSPCL